jgi:transcriptional regulator GlxA family with amidase domain
MRMAVLTFDGFNELDSFIASAMINRVKRPGWKAEIVSPSPVVVSGNGVRVERQQPLGFAREADVVLVGSGRRTLEVVADPAIMGELRLDPARQLIGAQCSGALVLAKLGLLAGQPACTDTMTRPYAIDAGLTVLDQPFHAVGNIATAGGCLGSHYLAAWVIARAAGRAEAEAVVHYVAPVGEKDAWTRRAMAAIGPYLAPESMQESAQESGGIGRRRA